ncbi:MFS transporter [Haloglycomyces albus]|uniref:MFS transporter n=1 Tax=Haloglycomyces albus TaxID=526067 RepID=UPI00046C9DF5|nr:MFS transporter [Haloglycomyces albus]
MTGLPRRFSRLDATARLLCVNQFGINAGFFMLMPYLAAYLTGSLGLAAGVVGILLGLRNFSQQGMFFLGGALADRWGYKNLIMAGCLLRTVGFGLLATVDALPGLAVGMIATGVAGALFNPAVRACLAEHSDNDRVGTFAVFNVFYQAGILAGPIIGVALATVNFQFACAVAAAIFTALTIVQARRLPSNSNGEHGGRERPSLIEAWHTVLTDRRFIAFALAMSGSYVLVFQTYLALPLLLGDHLTSTASTATIAMMFAVSGTLTIVFQVRITARCTSLLGRRASLVVGLLVLGWAFVPTLAVTAWTVPPAAVAVAVVVSGGLLALGTMITFPFEMDTVTALTGGQRIATHYGIYQTVCGVMLVAGNFLVGTAIDRIGDTWNWVPWLGLCALAVASAIGVLRIDLNTSEAADDRLASTVDRREKPAVEGR